MNKSIYDEALENIRIHEHQLEDTKTFVRKFDLLKKAKQALEKARKQEKLLALYKELLELNKKHTTFRVKRQLDIEKLIRELEDDK